MSDNNQITVKMHGIEATGTPEKIAELKKLLDGHVQIKYIPYVQTYPWTVQPYSQPYIYDKTTVNPYTITYGTSTSGSVTCKTSTDANCVTSNGSFVQNLHLTN